MDKTTQYPALRPYQIVAAERIERFLTEAPSRRLMVGPPGIGKGTIIAEAARQNEGRTLVIIHRQELVTQQAQRIRDWTGLRVGVEMGEQRAESDSQVVVASVQTVGAAKASRLAEFDFSLVVTDEAHRASAPSYRRAIERLAPGVHSLGFTATPDGATKIPLMGHEDSPFDGVLWEYPILQAVEDGWLADLRGWVVKTQTNLDTVRIVDGDFNEWALAEAVDTEPRTAAAFKAWLDLAPDRRTLAFCASVAHAQHVAEFWKSQGVAAQAVWGDMPTKDKEEALKRFRDGRTRVLTNCALLTEGVDYPAIDCVLMMRPTRSRTLFVQSIGRGMRLHPGKDHCVVIDLVDATKRLDLVTLPSFAGLPQGINLQGETFLNAFREAESLDIPKELRMAEMTLAELRMRATEVRLLECRPHFSSPSGANVDARVFSCETCGKQVRTYPYSDRLTRFCSKDCYRRQSESIVGKEIDGVKVLEMLPRTRKNAEVRCQCRCGKHFTVDVSRIKRERVSCGCSQDRKDRTGERYGRLVVVRYDHSKPSGNAVYLCRCDCGKEKLVSSGGLRPGGTQSCGCLRIERVFETKAKRVHRLDGELLSIPEIARKVGIPSKILDGRLRLGWTVERAISTPVAR